MHKIVKLGLTATLIAALALIGGCANIANDRTRTQTEGTLAGAGIGAALGAAIGAIAGGHRGALTGALIGAGVGGTAGLAYGTSVANKKADYASEEEWLAACLAEAQSVNQQTADYNSRLKTSLASYKKELSGNSYGLNEADQKTKGQALKKDLKESGEYLALLDQEITAQESAASSATDKAQAKNLQKQVDEMKKQKKVLEQNNQELAAISNRIAM
ncbi:MAG: hypothetical protein LBV79_07875 [Candidatus Adiutrix sp.]|jgi:hypothetical protein|nr:hypothetical protein [Candidatus Adiutrix sp.]